MRAWRLVVLLAAMPLLLAVDRPAGLGDVAAVRHWSYAGFTRVVVELSRPVAIEARRLGANPVAGRPERLYLDLPGIWVGLRYEEPIPIRDGLLQAVRLGQYTRTDSRLVIDLRRYERHRVFRLTSPDRVVVDVFGAESSAGGASGVRLPVGMRPVRTVVVDAGHGGKDPGAIGRGGLREKDVTVAVARALRDRLEARGFRVILTREGDQTLSLEERTARAEGAGGDLFVSLHANAAPRRSAHGVETYYLDKSHERHSLRVAARENGVSPRHLDELQRTVAGMRVSEVSEHSARLAESVHAELIGGIRQDYGAVTDLGVKRGPFHVLFLSDMPSILVELGFVTNRGESRRLESRFYRDVLAEHIARGLSRYRSRQATRLAGRAP